MRVLRLVHLPDFGLIGHLMRSLSYDIVVHFLNSVIHETFRFHVAGLFTKLSFSLSHLGENIMEPSFSVDVCLFPGIQILEFHFNASIFACKY
jgi:hypothetical protein